MKAGCLSAFFHDKCVWDMSTVRWWYFKMSSLLGTLNSPSPWQSHFIKCSVQGFQKAEQWNESSGVPEGRGNPGHKILASAAGLWTLLLGPFWISICSSFFSSSFPFFYWSLVDLQCCVSFRYTANWFIYSWDGKKSDTTERLNWTDVYIFIFLYIFIYIVFQMIFPYRLL